MCSPPSVDDGPGLRVGSALPAARGWCPRSLAVTHHCAAGPEDRPLPLPLADASRAGDVSGPEEAPGIHGHPAAPGRLCQGEPVGPQEAVPEQERWVAGGTAWRLARSWEAHTCFLKTPSQPGVFVLPSYLHWDFRLGCLGRVPEDPDSWAQKGHKRDLSCHCPGHLLGWVPLALVSLPLSRSSLGREVGGAGPGPRRGLRLHHGSASVNSMFVQCQRRPGSGSAPLTCPAVMGWEAHDT